LIVTGVPPGPEVGDILVIIGADVLVNVTPLLGTPLTTTTTGPVPAPGGTGTTILPAIQLVGVAGAPSKVIVLVPRVEPKFIPLTVTTVPTTPDDGERVVMSSVGRKVNVTPLLETPPTVTTTDPVDTSGGTGTTICVAFQVSGIAVTPLKVTMLVPCVEPNPVPVIVTNVPTGPDGGHILVMFSMFGVVLVPTTRMRSFPLSAM
jgi:hypothetical protein